MSILPGALPNKPPDAGVAPNAGAGAGWPKAGAGEGAPNNPPVGAGAGALPNKPPAAGTGAPNAGAGAG